MQIYKVFGLVAVSRQVSGAVEKYGSPHGIVISDREKLFADKNIVYIPLIVFSFV